MPLRDPRKLANIRQTLGRRFLAPPLWRNASLVVGAESQVKEETFVSRRSIVMIIVIPLALVATLGCCLALVATRGYSLDSIRSLIAQAPTPSPTPTKTPRPTHTPVPTSAPTATVTNTPVPTLTPVPPTSTPVPPAPTKKPPPPPPPTNTPVPEAPPPPVSPPPTPAPQYAWRGEIVGSTKNCGGSGVLGLTLDASGGLAGDIWVHYWTDGWDGDWDKSSWAKDDYNKTWDGMLDNVGPRAGTWYACVAPSDDSWDCISNRVSFHTSADCQAGPQWVEIVFQKN